MQFSQIYGEVANYFDAQAVTRAKLWTNEAYHDVLSRHRWTCLESRTAFATVAAQQDYVLSGTAPVVPDYDGVITVEHNDAAAGLKFKTLREFLIDDFNDLFGFAGATAGIPIAYCITGATPAANAAAVKAGGEVVLRLINVPPYVGTCRFHYWRSAASIELTADTDIPIVPVQYHRMIIDLATAIGLEAESQAQEAAPIRARAERAIDAWNSADELLRPTPRNMRPNVAKNQPSNPATGDPKQSPPYGRYTVS